MKALLRSTFAGDSQDNPQLLLRNYQALLSSGLEFDVPEYHAIWHYIQEFVHAHSHVPDVASIRSNFLLAREDSVLDQLERLVMLPALTKGDFLVALEAKANERRLRKWSDALKTAVTITQTGMKIEQKGQDPVLLRGPIDSARYLVDQAHDIVAPTLGGRLSGEVTKDGLAVLEEYERVESDPLAGIGQFTLLEQMDMALSGAKRQELWIHAAFTGGLKCITGDTLIFDVAKGRLRTALEISISGEAPVVHALDGHELKTFQASPVHPNGVRSILRVTTENGRHIRVSGNHPFFTPAGWVNAEDLTPGCWVAVAGKLPVQPETPSGFTDAEIRALGYLLGDGGLQEDLTFTNSSKELMSDLVSCLQEMGMTPGDEHRAEHPYFRIVAERPCKDPDQTTQVLRISRAAGKCTSRVSPLRELLARVGLYGCTSSDKFIPGEVFGCPTKQIWMFLSALWATDGRLDVEKTQRRHPRPTLWYATTSQNLAQGLQLLLQRVGIHTSILSTTIQVRNEPYTYWTVKVLSESWKCFLENISPKNKESARKQALSSLKGDTKYAGGKIPPQLLQPFTDKSRVRTRNGWYYAKYAKQKGFVSKWVGNRFANLPECPKEVKDLLQTEDVVWERIQKIQEDGEEQTFDLSVPGPANFVANGFITHNSTWALNWAYNQAIFYRHDSLFFSLEMPYAQCRRILYSIHSMHPKFRDVRRKLGLQNDPLMDVGIPYQHLRDGTLSEWHPQAKTFFAEFVVPDMNGRPVVQHPDFDCDYGKIHIEVADPDKDEFTITDLRTKAETIFAQNPFALLFVDHAGLMSPRRRHKGTTEDLNEVIRDLKKLALGFNRGQGMAVVGLFQINREGYKNALKLKEKTGKALYNLTGLSYANEAERSADIVTATWVDEELQSQNRVQFQCLKSRDQKPFDLFYARVEWPCRRLLSCFDVPRTPEENAKLGAEADKLLDQI